MVLGRRAHHGGAANVDILDDLVIAGAGGYGLLEWIEIDCNQIDRADFVCVHRSLVFGIVAYRKQAAMHLGVQRFDPAVHHFGKAGQVGNIAHRQAGLADQAVGATGRDQFNPGLGQPAGEIGHAGFVEYRKQCPTDTYRLAHEICLALFREWRISRLR